jgi:hypothetical protein
MLFRHVDQVACGQSGPVAALVEFMTQDLAVRLGYGGIEREWRDGQR